MKFKPLPSQDELKRLFSYQDGNLIWLVRTRYHNTLSKIAGYIDPKGYTRIRINKELYLAHRLIFKWHTGLEPEVVDHITHEHKSLHNKENPYDNRIENLYNGTFSDNNQNRAIKTKHYYFCNRTQRFRVGKRIRGKTYDKRFKTEEEAINYVKYLETLI